MDEGADGINWATTVKPVKKMILGIVKILLKISKLENKKKSAVHKINHKIKVTNSVFIIWYLSFKAKKTPSLKCFKKLIGKRYNINLLFNIVKKINKPIKKIII